MNSHHFFHPGRAGGSVARCTPIAALALALAACSSTPPSTPTSSPVAAADVTAPAASTGNASDAPEAWKPVAFPGKQATRYAWEFKDGRRVVHASADKSASMWRRTMKLDPTQLGEVDFSWWVTRLLPKADVSDAEHADAPVRVMFAFAGGTAKLSVRNRMMFELAETLTGEQPPYATLVYTWDNKAPVDSVVIHPRSDRVRKIVLDSGAARLGQWCSHRRNLADDFRRAFGEAPGALVAVAFMTDADNTQSSTEAWYGDVSFAPPATP